MPLERAVSKLQDVAHLDEVEGLLKLEDEPWQEVVELF